MSMDQVSSVADIFQKAGMGWLIPSNQYRDRIVGFLDTLKHVEALSGAQHGVAAIVLDAEVITSEFKENPERIASFLQVYAESGTNKALLLAWRVLHGWEIKQASIRYELQKEFQMTVLIANRGVPDQTEEYETKDINDIALFRHFGIFKLDGLPVIDGFYPLNIR